MNHRNAPGSWAAVALIVVAGCQPNTPPLAGAGAPLKSAPLAASPSTPPVTAEPVEVLRTKLSPDAAATRVAVEFRDTFHFAFLTAKGEYAGNGTLSADDYFYASVDVETAEGHRVHVTCHWVADQATDVTITGDLPPDQRRVVVEHVRQVL